MATKAPPAHTLSLFLPLPVPTVSSLMCLCSCCPLFCLWSLFCYGCCLPMQGPEDPTHHPLTAGSQHSSSVLPLAGPLLSFLPILLFSSSYLTLINTFLSPTHTFLCLAPAGVQFLCTSARTVPPQLSLCACC